MSIPFIQRRGIGVVEIFGAIGSNVRVPLYNRILESLSQSRRIKAVVVDIDSPGGTASASEGLYYSLMKVAQVKPVVAHIRGIGASGGYFISCAATRIVATPSALVGSIGVLYLRPVLQELLAKVGVSFSVYKGGHLKDMGGFWRSPTSEEESKFKGLIDEIYDNFVKAVADGRHLEESKVREYATGEVFTARRACELGLVDELGDFDRALDIAADLGRTRRRPIWIRPRRPMLERLLGRPTGKSTVETLIPELERLLLGGIYFIAPPYVPGGSRY